jgi:hypothetical protein
MLKYKIYLSDEGYGHIVRQKAILDKLVKYSSSTINFTLQTQNHLKVAKEIFGKGKYVNKYNNISWQKQENGSPDLKKIKFDFENYESKSKDFIVESKDLEEFDFLVSDFVYEAFQLGSNYNIPTFWYCPFYMGLVF